MKTGAKNTLRQQGFALVIALAYLLFLSMFATAFLRAVRMNMTDAFNDEARIEATNLARAGICLLYTSPSPRDRTRSRMPSSA